MSRLSDRTPFHVQRVALLAFTVLPMLVGCALNTTSAGVPRATSTVLMGKAIGGEQPISGATVSIYSTAATGTAQSNGTYSGTATLLATTTSRSDGSFTFTGSPTCSTPDQVYVTASGGNSGANAINSSILLIAAVGDCSNLTSNLFVNINEVTTVAAAYALSGFISIPSATSTVNITSSSTNYAGVFNGSAYSGSTTKAAGLAHAFLNANSLASYGSGSANVSVPGNTSSKVPTAEINSIANILQSCVNSGGGSATSATLNDGTACGKLFSYTTGPTGTPPGNTLQAVINMARYPGQNVASLFNLGTPAPAFQPVLTSAPNDWLLAVLYSTASGNSTYSTGYIFQLAADANDDIYSVDIASTYNGGNNKSACIVAFSSSGQLLSGSSGWGCSTTFVAPRQISADQNGYIWVANNGSTGTTTAVVEQISTSTGAVTTYSLPANSPYGVAVDANGNVWANVSSSTSASNEIYEISLSGSAYSGPTAFAKSSGMANTFGLTIDAASNIWGASSTSTGSASIFTTPYTANVINSSTTTTYSGAQNPLAIDANGTGWVAYNNTTYALIPYTYSSGLGTLTAGAAVTNASFVFRPYASEADGTNTLWTVEYTNGLSAYSIGSASFAAAMPGATAPYTGCLPSTTPITCSKPFSTPRSLAIDSTGSIWLTSGLGAPANYGVVQFIGAAAPTWPLLAIGKFGVMP